MRTTAVCEAVYDGTLEGLFALLDRFWAGPATDWPRRVYTGGAAADPGTAGLFDGGLAAGGFRVFRTPPGLLPDPAALEGTAGVLFQVSADAYNALVCVWMSEFPLEAQALRYGLRVLAAAKEAVPVTIPWYASEEARRGAALAAQNRGDDDCRTVLAASYKVAHEINRLMGFLRFKPGAGGRYVARCSPDHFILPALEGHFTRRFGDTPWAVIDEKRGLVLEGEGRIVCAGEVSWGDSGQGSGYTLRCGDSGHDAWEKLWRSYHRTISIENRKNPSLQRQFVPSRYREYLTEFNPD